MLAARAKAPTLAWLLTVLTGLLIGMAIVESRHQAVALPHLEGTRAPAGAVETVEVGSSPAGVSEPTPTPIRGPGEQPVSFSTPGAGEIPVPLSTGPVVLRVTRLVVPPGVGLPPEGASGWTVLLVESGTLSVRVASAALAGWGLDADQLDAPLSAGGRLVIVPGARYAVRNDGPTLVEALAVTLDSVDTPAPLPDSG